MTAGARSTEGPGSRQRLVTAAVTLLARQGYEATTVNGIAVEGAAPMGSFYFHFPGGKEEIGVAALRYGTERFAERLGEVLARHASLADALAGCADWLADELVASEWADGCPIAATALESVTRSPALRVAAAAGFELWRDVLRRRLSAEGISDEAAVELATNVLSLIEGAELLARTQASPDPLHRAASALRILATAALAAASVGDPAR
jgi:TetR/AcrR family transcriptional regulator, lmrAB and yxaGH operons repressor